MAYQFDHEMLDVYRLTLEVMRWLNEAEFPRGHGWLREQVLRSCGSVVLNIAEGRSRGGDAGRNHYRVALGSAAETCAALDIAALPDSPAQQEKLRRVGAMLARLARP
jgi:four helix bundle protein